MQEIIDTSHFRVLDLLTVAQDGYSSILNVPVFPVEFIEQLPTNCPECGVETVITKTLSILSCSASNCIGSASQRLVALIKDLGVLDMGLSKSKAFFDYYGVSNPYAIFAFEPVDSYGNPSPDGGHVLASNISHAVSLKIYNQIDKKRNMTLAEYVKIGNLKGIRDTAYHLFDAYDSLTEFYRDFEHGGGVAFIQKKLNISADTVSVTAYNVTKVLIENKADLFEFIDYVNIKPLKIEDESGVTRDVKRLNICMSTSVGAPYKSKADFISQMNDKYGESLILTVLGGVTNTCDILVWSGNGAVTSKVRKAESVNKKAKENLQKELEVLLPYHQKVDSLAELDSYILELTNNVGLSTLLKTQSDVDNIVNNYNKVLVMSGADFDTYLSQI